MYGYIYITTNLINGKKYIGRHKSSVFVGEKYLGSGTDLLQDIEKYGKENFTVKEIEKCFTRTELIDCETYWLKYYNVAKNNEFYNIYEGKSFINTKPKKKYIYNKIKQIKKPIKKNRICIKKGRRKKFICLSEFDKYREDGWKETTYISQKIYQTIYSDQKINSKMIINNGEIQEFMKLYTTNG